MDKINKLVLAVIPNQRCNLKCEYCYISQVEDWDDADEMKYSPEHIAKALSKERLGGVSLINLTGNGETMLQSNIVDIIRCLLLEGHYVEVVTNGTIRKNFDEIVKFPRPLLDHLFFKLSFHYKELTRLGILDKFYDTVNLLKKNNIAFTLELMAYDGIEKDIDAIADSCTVNTGAVCQSTIGRSDQKRGRELLSNHTESEYWEIWSKLQSPMQRFKLDIIGKKRKEFCYAGAWSLFIDLYTGNAKACYRQPYNQNIFDDITKPIKFCPVGHYCLQPYCINGHAHLTWGLIPELDTPMYLEMRNRICLDGSEWVNNSCKSFFQTKLYQSNTQYSFWKKITHTLTYPFRYIKYVLWNPSLNVSRLNKLRDFWRREK